jgi:hypothetical protein
MKTIVAQTIGTQNITADVLPIFLVSDVEFSPGPFSGYHSVLQGNPNQTYIVASYMDTSAEAPDVTVLSHEIGEWMDNPLGVNNVPAWGPTPQLSCDTRLEVGDPLEGDIRNVVTEAFTYHVQELAYFSWFARNIPSLAANGQYSTNGSFASPAPPCSTVSNTLVSIAVTPFTATVASNSTQQFTAIGTYADGSTQNITSSVTWSSSTGATISQSGLATGVTPGATSTIMAAQDSVSGSATLRVAYPLISIAVTPSTATVAPNGTQQFTATGTYADGSTQNITSSVTWSASTGATVTPSGLATGVTPGATSTMLATQGSVSGSATLRVANPLMSIAVSPASQSVSAGLTVSFTATGTYADGSTNVITTSVTWSSSVQAIATISNAQGSQGVVTGVAAGSTSVTASMGSITSPAATLRVTNATLRSIAVTPANPAIVFSTQQPFAATGTFSDGSTLDITSSVTWSSSDLTKILITPTGLATGVGTTTAGQSVTITATKNSVTGSTTATVILPSVVSIAITPGTTKLAQNTSRQYTATATLANGGTLNVSNLSSWSSSDATIATVGSSTGVVQAKAVTSPDNLITISVSYTDATQHTVTQSIALDVTDATVQTITVTPSQASIPVGIEESFDATGTFSDGTTQDIAANVTWSSSFPDKVSINSSGVAMSLSEGIVVAPTNITAVFEGVMGWTQVTVNGAKLLGVAIGPTQTVLPVGKTINYQAVGNFNDGSSYFITTLATWSSSDPTLVQFTAPGVATTLKPGTITVGATYQQPGGSLGTSNNASVIVTQFPLVSLSVTPATGKVPVETTTQFQADGTFSDGSTQILTNYVTWVSSPPSVATITDGGFNEGIATGVSPGQASITALLAGVVSNTSTLTVSTATIVSIAVTPNPASGPTGTQKQFTAVGTFDDGSTIDVTTEATWTSSDVTVATINGSGTANIAGASGKTATIKATITQNGITVSDQSILIVQ